MSVTAPALSTISSNAAADAAAANARLSAKTSSATGAVARAQEQSDRFLKLLVTQMKNQDPLNPMDNAQITSQMAQISTVSGIDKLSAAVTAMNTLMLQTQSLEGAALVGKDVLVAGDKLSVDAAGKASGGFELDSAAQSVVVTVKDANNKVLGSMNLGAAAAGRHSFDWAGGEPLATGLKFEIKALNGADTVGVTKLAIDQVASVFTEAGQLNISLKNNGHVKYSDVKSVG